MLTGSLLLAAASPARHVTAALRDVPVLADVDVVVAGGTSAAVAAACAAAERGARVMLLAPRPYLGDDLCGRQRLWLDAGETPATPLARALFPAGRVTTPFTIKHALDQALLRAGVRWLTGCVATDLLVDAQGRPSGVVVVDRGGSQAVRAKVVIDATRWALLARQAGASFRPFVAGEQELRWTVVGGELQSGPGLVARTLDVTLRNPKRGAAQPVHEYSARLALPADDYASLSRAEHALRDRVAGVGMQDWSEYAGWLPAATLVGEAGGPLGASRPRGVARLYVLSERTDLAPDLARPLVALASGELVGQAAASEARQVAPVGEVGLAPVTAAEVVPAVVGEPRDVSAPPATGAVRVGQRALPVWGAYDVVVVGGGTAGAPAGIGAARAGARTLVVEYLDELGGVGTAGLIGSYWYGRREGFTREIEDAIGGSGRWPTGRGGWNVLQKAEWLRRELLKAGAELWFGAFGCGALLDQGKVSGVVVATPAGRGVVLAKTVVDATGNADIADCAGAETQFGVAAGGVLAVQLAGYPHRNLGDNVNNTCFALVDDTSVVDVWHLTTWMRAQMAKDAPYDAGQLLDTRERRRIVADYTLTTPDILTGRRFADTISHHKSNFDASAFPTSPLLLVKDMKGPAFEVDLPYRCLLPKGLDGLLVTGLGAGAERDAMTLIRMQADVQNQGYAAGLAAAMAAAIGGHPRQVDRRGLQARLVAQGVLAERVLTDTDVPPSDAALARAVAEVGAMSRAVRQQRTVEDRTIFPLAMLMAHGERARPLLRQAYAAAAEPGPKLTYAQILGVLGDATGADTLAVAVAGAATWDQGYGWTSHRESDNTFSELDRLVIALGWSGARAALPVLVAKLGQLAPDDSLSHFVALALALHRHDRPASAAADLARLLATPGFAGHALLAPVAPPGGQLAPRANAGTDPRTALNTACRELLVAGMLVHCGDQEGRGQAVLETYARGVYGHFARYARHLLPRSIAR